MPSFEVISDVTSNLFRMTGKQERILKQRILKQRVLKHQQQEAVSIMQGIMQGIICPPLLAHITSTFYLFFTLKIDFLRRENGTPAKNIGGYARSGRYEAS